MKTTAILLEPGSTSSSIMTTLDMFRIASRLQPEESHRLDLLSTRGGTVHLSAAVGVETQRIPSSLSLYDAVILPGFFATSVEHVVEQVETTWQTVIARLRSMNGRPLVAASCYGTFVLAEAGLLDDMKATTTWWMERNFRQRYPKVLLDADSTLVDSGKVITGGAVTAHTDLSLHILRRLSGVAAAH